MCAGIALLQSEFPLPLLERADLRRRCYRRGNGEHEFRFFWREPNPLLPIILDGTLQLVTWGSKRRKGALPLTGYTWIQSIREGKWSHLEPKTIQVAATAAYENGVWYPVRLGLQGLLVYDEDNLPHVYLICRESTRYYFVMTKSKWQPILIGESI
jgi:hypothetical protein